MRWLLIQARDRRAYLKKRETDLEGWRAQQRDRSRRLRARRREFINGLKLNRACADCGGNFPPYIMHFHHIDGSKKVFNVGRATGLSEATILNEVSKCELLCANCHGIRTWSNDG
jgi:hypothetical protein